MQRDNEFMNELVEVAARLHQSFVDMPRPEPRDHPFPDRQAVIKLIYQLRDALFPGYFNRINGSIDITCLVENLGSLFWSTARLIHDTVAHDCPFPCEHGCGRYRESAYQAGRFISRLPEIRRALNLDIQAAFEGDPAAKDLPEVILAYPGLFAVMVYRVAHELQNQGIRLIPRIMTEHAHSVTGIDIHPAARIGHSFFIDHGTGVVIGETCVIGNNVKIYQGVTLGALSIPRDEEGKVIRTGKRHPTIEDDVIVYAGATILGGNTVIGKGSVIGGNVWLIESVPPGSKVLNRPTIEMRS